MRTLFYIAFLFIALSAAAQENIIQQIEQAGPVTVTVPDALIPFLSFNAEAAAKPSESEEVAEQPKQRVGYRVQVFDDNNVRTAKTQAQERKHLIENRFPEFTAYVTFNSPYWRVKVGDFHTRSEAEAAMGAIRAAFPSIGSQLRVVRDKINSR